MKFSIVIFSIMCLIALSVAENKAEHEPTKDEHEHEDEHSGGHKPYERPISDKEHHEDEDELHDPSFDHQSFLGKDESEKFDHLNPEESKQRLGDLVDKVDKNGDKKITEEELQEWIRNIGKKSMQEDTKRQFDALEPKTEDGKVKFETYSNQNFGKPEKKEMDAQFKETLAREQRKWKLADQDGDGSLSLEEFTAFIHPEEAPHMRDIVIEEAMADMDKDKDGYISLEEYLQDQYPKYKKDIAMKKKLPEWVEKERKEFQTKLDKDKDGKLSPQEVYRWIVPEDFDKAIKEAKHLISKSDTNKDGVLTKEEILNNHDLFAGSQATDFGSELNRHDEL